MAPAGLPRVDVGEVMDLLFEVRKRARDVVWPVLAICALAYVAYHIVNGDRGLVAWRALRDAVVEAKREADGAEAERLALAHKVRLLHPDSIDPDMLEEMARRQLHIDIARFTNGFTVIQAFEHRKQAGMFFNRAVKRQLFCFRKQR